MTHNAVVDDDAAGFTLIELLLSVSIIVIVLGAISSAFIVFLKNADYSIRRDDHSGGAMITSSYLDRDFASADTVHTSANTICSGVANTLLLTWGEASASDAVPQPEPSSAGRFQAAYFLSPDPSSVPVGPNPPTRYKLQRALCVDTGAADTQTLIYNLASTDVVRTSGNTCLPAGKTTPVTLTVAQYESDSADDYTYTGCIKGRLR